MEKNIVLHLTKEEARIIRKALVEYDDFGEGLEGMMKWRTCQDLWGKLWENKDGGEIK